MKNHLIKLLPAIALSLFSAGNAQTACAGDPIGITIDAGVTINAGTGDFAPYHISANRGGTVTQQYSTLLDVGAYHTLDTTKRLSWGAGVEFWGGWSSSTDYKRLKPDIPYPSADGEMLSQHPARVWVQELYVTGKYRGVFLTLGQQEKGSPWLNQRLSSGDLIRSGNARPGYGASAGFVNFQNIPLTKGWVQIAGELGYYRLGDGKWLENHYNYAANFITTGYWLNYKNLYLRTNPFKPFVFTVGMQAACQFGGTIKQYATTVNEHGQYVATLQSTTKMDCNAKAFFKALIPGSGGNASGDHYYEGNHVGSWDLSLKYNFKNGASLKAYLQKPFEDGSGIGWKNGFDGLWGLEYNAGKRGIVSAAVIEYLDLTNHSGPLHFNPGDYASVAESISWSQIDAKATGSDDYYNNYAYNGYQNRGMAIGSPMVKSPLYHTDGYMRFFDNRLRGFHIALEGDIIASLSYRAMYSWRKSWGNIFMPRTEPVTQNACMLEASYNVPRVKGLQLNLQLALDHGSLYNGYAAKADGSHTNFGALLAVRYRLGL